MVNYDGEEYQAIETLKAGGAAIDSLTINYFPSALGPEGNFVTINTSDRKLLPLYFQSYRIITSIG